MSIQRDVQRLNAAPRCGAKTRQGTPCKAPAANGKGRCRMHGGAKGSGAPKGNQNAFKHGAYSKDSIELMKQVKAMMRESEELLEALHGD